MTKRKKQIQPEELLRLVSIHLEKELKYLNIAKYHEKIDIL